MMDRKLMLAFMAMLALVVAGLGLFVYTDESASPTGLVTATGEISYDLDVQYEIVSEPLAGVAYTPSCLAECHLPLSMTFGEPYTVDAEEDFAPRLTEGIGNYEFDAIEFRRLRTWMENLTRWIPDVQCTEVEEETANETTSSEECVDNGYEEIYPVVREEWEPFSPLGFTFEPGVEYVIDLVGRRKARLGKSAVDAQFCFSDGCTTEFAWWEQGWTARRAVTITNNTNVPIRAGFTLNITMDTSEWGMKPDGGDIRFVYNDYTDLDWVSTTAPNSTRATFWIKLQDDIPVGAADSTHYYVYYGNGAAGNPPQDVSRIFSSPVNTSAADYGECILIVPLDEGSGTRTVDLCNGTVAETQYAQWNTYGHPVGPYDGLRLGGSGMYKNTYIGAYNFSFGRTPKSNQLGVTDFFISYWELMDTSSGGGFFNFQGREPERGRDGDGFSVGRSGSDNSMLYWQGAKKLGIVSAVAPSRKWHHIVYYRARWELGMYVDGVFNRTNSPDYHAREFYVNYDMRLGQSYANGDGFYGTIDDFMIVKGTPTQKMVDDLYMGRMYHVPIEPTVTLGEEEAVFLPDITVPIDLQPDPAYTNDTITTSGVYSEAQYGASGTVFGRWYADSFNVYTEEFANVPDGTLVEFSLPPQYFTEGQVISFSAQAKIFGVSTQMRWANTLLILNSPPLLHYVQLDAESYSSSDTIGCSALITDVDEEPITVTHTFESVTRGILLQSSSQVVDAGTIASASLPGTAFSKLEVIRCTVSASDGTETAEGRIGIETTILNTPPAIDSLALDADTYTDTEPMTCTLRASDGDHDDLTVTLAFMRGAEELQSESSEIGSGQTFSSTLDSSSYSVGDEIACAATATDGTDTGTDSILTEILAEMRGTVSDSEGAITQGGQVIVIDQGALSELCAVPGVYCTISDSGGKWSARVRAGTYIAISYDPADTTKDGDADPHIVVS